ncbi:YchJ family protein [Flavobacterium antarcticum]|uniref:YchJ family protein n=1 Tax=Flavobacterium antarcticum TaxID=271155 RepID=UPI0003B3C33E|nr:YchJ family metal-binding protein [Flavobacterium antarcticum]
MKNCYCGSEFVFEKCCKPIIEGAHKATTAEKLMRSRYTAYCIHDADYLVATTDISTRKLHQKEDILQWSQANHWLKLEIISSEIYTIEFKAYYLDGNLKATIHHEKSTFSFENGSWFYVDGIFF